MKLVRAVKSFFAIKPKIDDFRPRGPRMNRQVQMDVIGLKHVEEQVRLLLVLAR